MIRLVFDNAKVGGTPRVYRETASASELLQNVRHVTIFPGRLCEVVLMPDPRAWDEAAQDFKVEIVEDMYVVDQEVLRPTLLSMKEGDTLLLLSARPLSHEAVERIAGCFRPLLPAGCHVAIAEDGLSGAGVLTANTEPEPLG